MRTTNIPHSTSLTATRQTRHAQVRRTHSFRGPALVQPDQDGVADDSRPPLLMLVVCIATHAAHLIHMLIMLCMPAVRPWPRRIMLCPLLLLQCSYHAIAVPLPT